MNASDTIAHFADMGVLDRIIVSLTGKTLIIFANAPRGYAERCMKDFKDSESYFASHYGIDARTDDDVVVRMTFV